MTTGSDGAPMRFLGCGDDALLVELGGLDEALALAGSLADRPVRGVADVVPGARTVLLQLQRAADRDAVRREVAARSTDAHARPEPETVEIRVVYDGDDLEAVAGLTGLAPGEVVARHAAATYEVAFTGFAPGFAYLSGLDPALRLPRRGTPRARIPAGAVAIAGDFAGVYPTASPGGWHLLGRAVDDVWDLARTPPALLRPGMRVRFVPVERDEAARGAAEPREPAAAPAHAGGPAALEVVATGPHALIEDEGRPGLASLGVAPSGAMDRAALRRANALVGSEAGAAAIETALGGLRLRATADVVVAVTGAPAPVSVARRGTESSAPFDTPLPLAAGDELSLGPAPRGVYSYVAVRGGVDVVPVLGSASRDVLAALGPAPCAPGDALSVGSRVAGAVEPWQAPAGRLPAPGETVPLDLVLGPRQEWFAPDALEALVAQDWVVSPRSNRTGLRLEGTRPLARAREGELPSEGVVTGALQVPSDGQPILFAADRPLTGGYPVIGVVARAGLDLAAQAPPGARIRFRLV